MESCSNRIAFLCCAMIAICSCSTIIPTINENALHGTIHYYGYYGGEFQRRTVLLDLYPNGSFDLYYPYMSYYGKWEKDGRTVILKLDNPKTKTSWYDDFDDQLFYSDLIRIRVIRRPLRIGRVYNPKNTERARGSIYRKRSFDILMKPFPSDAPVFEYRPVIERDTLWNPSIHSIDPPSLSKPRIIPDTLKDNRGIRF